MIGCLNHAEQVRLEQRRLSDPFVDKAIGQVERILASDTFVRTQREARSFLAFIVAKQLLGEADQIKEMTIAIRAFRESAKFDPLESSKVRVAGFSLRRRVAAYYAGEGRRDLIEIVIPTGTYAPRIRYRKPQGDSRLAAKRSCPKPP